MLDNKAKRSSSKKQAELIEAVGKAVQAFQDASDAFDERACVRLGISRTDLRCLGVISQRGPMPVGEVGREVKLTRGATTTALDRVERAGYTRRINNPEDRRGVLIEMTPKGWKAAAAIWEPMAKEGGKRLSSYTVAELDAILRFLTDARLLQLEFAEK